MRRLRRLVLVVSATGLLGVLWLMIGMMVLTAQGWWEAGFGWALAALALGVTTLILHVAHSLWQDLGR